jgi:hypothetical protein
VKAGHLTFRQPNDMLFVPLSSRISNQPPDGCEPENDLTAAVAVEIADGWIDLSGSIPNRMRDPDSSS